MSKKAVIGGGSGFIGNHLANELEKSGYEVAVLTRSPDAGARYPEVKWDAKSLGDWVKEFEGADAVFNLTGAPIEKKWTDEYKKVIVQSRVDSTCIFAEAIKASKTPPRVWVNSSAIGFYGDRGDEMLSESSSAGTGFLPETCLKWESSIFEHSLPKTRKVAIRTGIVLGKESGMYPVLKSITEKFLGGAAGDGKQWVSWIHVDDLVRMMVWSLNSGLEGPINATAPNPVTNANLMEAMREDLGRPPVPPAPPFLINLATSAIGKEGALILQGQRVHPVIAQANGFNFLYPKLHLALSDLNR